jgi:phycocyanobilin:ferredoxin oxidoreductase
MNCIDYLDSVARDFCGIIQQCPGAVSMPTPDYGWENHRWTGHKFRMAHVELFRQDRFMVVHACVFPHATDPSAIFGFDVIAGEHKVTGVFFDLSPTVEPSQPFAQLAIATNRARPEWGDIFSQHWIACRPSTDELQTICGCARTVLSQYLSSLGRDCADAGLVTAAQNRYCLQQRRNEHTTRAIENLLGAARAQEFITQILFPTVEQ